MNKVKAIAETILNTIKNKEIPAPVNTTIFSLFFIVFKIVSAIAFALLLFKVNNSLAF